MSGADFAKVIASKGYSQSSLARKLHALGDPRSVPTILRSISNYCRGVTAVPGEMVALLTLLPRADAS
jgi:hypothetical protein